MPVKLYKMKLSPPACAAMMICEIHNVPVEMIDVDLIKRENYTPEFLKKNPMHTVPVLEDGNLILHDSNAILTYINEMYGKDDSLYPKDLKQRALVDQKLFFNTLLFTRLRNVTYAAIIEGVRKPSEKMLKEIEEAYGFLEAFLNNSKFVAGDRMTLADIAIVATVSGLRHIIAIDPKQFPKLNNWFMDMEKQPFFQKCTVPGSKILKDLLKEKLDLM
ncbi:glutathione S-transferase 1-like isoform X2 [Danaus plexippus]|nr:glutathione S-transferase 1-like isoform X2 [Danaus plexippus]XP_061377931.1 glutathione S-transferase 1-like isoform X2 [Danaus plexippus]